MHDVIVIGGGIVGLSASWQLKTRFPDLRIAVLEKESQVAQHQTGHNSGVIHSGIYYRPGSLKAENCTKGYHALLQFCSKYGIPYEICGKIIVATKSKEIPILEQIYQRGIENGLTGLQKLSPDAIREREPHCRGLAGILVPQTGIVSYPDVANKMAALFEQAGGELVTNAKAKTLTPLPDGILVKTETAEYPSRFVVNCAGLYADVLALQTFPQLDIRIIPFRGAYYQLKASKRHLVNHLIYPVPNPAFPFLGVHFTRKLDGSVECGPNAVLAFAREGYRRGDVNLSELLGSVVYSGFRKVAARYWRDGLEELHRSWSKTAFAEALQHLVPEVTAEDLEPGGSGVRAQACDSNGRLLDDFYFVKGRQVLHVCNAPSPAATASIAIGAAILDQVIESLGLQG